MHKPIPAGSADSGPRTALVWPYNAQHWGYRSTMPVLRERYGTRFVVLAPSDDIPNRYRDALDPDDEIVISPDPATLPVSFDGVWETARRNEVRYGINYMRDVVQMDRSLFTKMSGVAPNSMFGTISPPDLETIYARINAAFDWVEELFDRFGFDVVFSWPISMQDACCAYVAARRGILVTHPYPAKLGNRAFWATGPFVQSYQHREAYDRVGSEEIGAAEGLSSPHRPVHLASSKVSDLYAAPRIAKDLILLVLEYALHWIADIRAGRWPHKTPRASFFRSLWLKFRSGQYFRRFARLCEPDLQRISKRPFVFYAFHQEPEFTVQAQAKDFNDQMAIIRQLAKSMPAGVNLVIKEHATLGFRNLSYYEELVAFPNVILASPDIPGPTLVGEAAAVVSLRGTVTLEAAVAGKPAIVFVPDTEFAMLPNVRCVEALADLVDVLTEVTAPIPDATAEYYRDCGARFRAAVAEISFPADPLFRKDGSLLEPEDAERAVDMLIGLWRLHAEREKPKTRASRTAAVV